MPRHGYQAITVSDGLIGEIDDLVDHKDVLLSSRPKVIFEAIKLLSRKKSKHK